ncbi:energy-coupling factor ABC transporter ATP-binding protein [Desulfomonile tiedjei]|uniref:ABC-type cobalt transport system, ATPase component n=1 Tax=Desulfomonile tiedjei (strain ATCC 49306 / DSM 6799 / DCB-1) TaxID=706587 RepID=I4C8H6_DESTA|nr:ABC transporter ATP-binding protein [Desulfomonile tiedjei]AFM25867.1 ABC-type cobalt transport system, ATPase component [Desulfomonile tiedjei DSM 6799]
MIRLRDIRFRYDTRYVLDGVTFSLNPGDRVGLVGPNGSGKTTLCHIIMGLAFPESGIVEIFGKQRTSESDFAEIRGRIGFLFQDADDQLFCPTVLEDVAFGPLNMGKSPEEAKRIVRETLRTLKLEGFEERITYKLSGGEKRLVSLATVLAMEPEVLILDEPTSGLDEETTERIIEVLHDLNLSYIVISHDRDFVQKTTNSLLKISRGNLVEA